ncbi:MAG: ferritin-like domain-containing protein [Halodesulfurarchaeum sp.]
MKTTPRVESNHQLARLLQIGVVLEEVVEARAYEHYQRLPRSERDSRIEGFLESVRKQSADHRKRLETLIDELDAPSVSFEEIEELVSDQYAQTRPEDFDGILYDQLHGEETSYKYYDDLIGAIEESEEEFRIERDRVLSVLRSIREEEAAGVGRIADLMEDRA